MAQFENYKNLATEEQKTEFLNQQRQKGLGHIEEQGNGFGFLSKDLLEERFRERKRATSFADRTKYYFEDATVMQAKAQRYRNLADNGRDIEAYANRFGNRSARKRKKSAVAAADAFDHAAALEEQYRSQMQEQDSVTQFQQKKEIMEARLLGMKKAAEVKSTSQENETYRMLKAEISCLSILKEQGQELEKQEQNAQQKEQLRAEIKKVRKDLVKAQQKLSRVMPSPQKQWMNQVYSETKVKAQYEQWKQVNPDLTEEDTRVNMILQQFGMEVLKPEYTRALQALENNGMYQKEGKPYKYEAGDNSRFCAFAIRAVMMDEHGQPINKTELEKDRHNKEWLRALQTGDVELKNRVLLDQFHYVENLRIPSPREIRERGIEFYFEKDPALFFDCMRLGGMFDNLKGIDSVARQYEQDHPLFSAKLTAIGTLGGIFDTYMRGKHLYHPENGVDEKFREDAEEKISEERMDGLFESYQGFYDAAYKDPYGVGIDGVVLGYLNENEREALKLYAGSHPDEYDEEMRRKIVSPTESPLGTELLKKTAVEDLSDLTGQAYQALHGATISRSKRMQRAETAVEKKKLQRALRNRLENCLIERQRDQAIALAGELFHEVERVDETSGEVIREMKRIDDPEEILHVQTDPVVLRFAGEWTELENKKKLLTAASGQLRTPEMIRKAGEIMEGLDLSAFEYRSDTEFVSKIQDNYRWIQKADALREYCRMAQRNGWILVNSPALEARLRFFAEMKVDYDARIAMMNSPYYALLANADLSGLSDADLQRKVMEADGGNHGDLAEFLRNYRILKNRGAAFGKGGKADDRYAILLNQVQPSEPQYQQEENVEDAIIRMSEEEQSSVQTETISTANKEKTGKNETAWKNG